MKLEKLHEDDVIREDTEVGDVRATEVDFIVLHKNIFKKQVSVDCYDDKNSEYLSISFDYIEGIDMDKYIDMALPALINEFKRMNNESNTIKKRV